MTAIARLPLDNTPPPRAKRLPLKLVTRGSAAAAELPPDVVRGPGALDLLAQAPASVSVLIAETCRKIPEFFGTDARVALKAVADVGEVTVEHLLYLVIAVALSAADAVEAYDRFLEEWWIDNVGRGHERVHIGLELL